MDYSHCRFFYGTESKNIEVTTIIQQQCLNEFGNVELLAPMNTLFGDPCRFKPKKLFCKSVDGVVQQIIHEGQTGFPKYQLACCATIQNESSSDLTEWLDHYIREGVERFYLRYHATRHEMLKPYIQQDLVKLFTEPGEPILAVAKREAEWLICCDLNEWIDSSPRVVDHLKTLDQDVSALSLPSRTTASIHIYRTRYLHSLPAHKTES